MNGYAYWKQMMARQMQPGHGERRADNHPFGMSESSSAVVNVPAAIRSGPVPVTFIEAKRSGPIPANVVAAVRSGPVPAQFGAAVRSGLVPAQFGAATRSGPVPAQLAAAVKSGPVPAQLAAAVRSGPVPNKVMAARASGGPTTAVETKLFFTVLDMPRVKTAISEVLSKLAGPSGSVRVSMDKANGGMVIMTVRACNTNTLRLVLSAFWSRFGTENSNKPVKRTLEERETTNTKRARVGCNSGEQIIDLSDESDVDKSENAVPGPSNTLSLGVHPTPAVKDSRLLPAVDRTKIINIPEKTSEKRDGFPGCLPHVKDTVDRRMAQLSDSDFIVEGKTIRKSDLNTVYSPNTWLNDEVIRHYLNLIVDRDAISIHMFDTFFFEKLSSQGYQSVRRWSRKKDIFSCKKMFVPIHQRNHWTLVCVNFVEKTVSYYDSFGGKNPACLDIIFKYLQQEHLEKKHTELDTTGWRLSNEENCPRQGNGYDCGVFTCVNAEYLSRDAILDFTQNDMPMFRKRICYELLNNRLCQGSLSHSPQAKCSP